MDDDPFAALVAEMNTTPSNTGDIDQSATATVATTAADSAAILSNGNVGVQQQQQPEETKGSATLTAKDEVQQKPASPSPPQPQPQPLAQQKHQPQQEKAIEQDVSEPLPPQPPQPQQPPDATDIVVKHEQEVVVEDDADNAFLEMVHAVQDLEQLRQQFIAFRKEKDGEMYELKNKFTEISRRQKEVFIEVESRRKTAVNKGKKYKQTAQKLYYQIQKLNNDLKFERQKKEEFSAEVAVVRNQKKEREKVIEQLTSSLGSLQSNLSETEQAKHQILDEFQQTHSVIDQLLQHERVQATLKCVIEVTPLQGGGDEAKDAREHGGNTNLCIAKLRFLDSSLDASTVSIQWNRSFFTHLLPIKNATRTQYMLSADDVGSMLKVEVRSKSDPDCFETAVLKSGAVRMHTMCNKLIQENLLRISKQQVEFEVEPDLEEQNTAKLLASQLKDGREQVKSLILLFNRDKIKLRLSKKNHTIDKEEYNEGMRMTLSAMNHNRFSLKLSPTKKYVLLSKTPFDRDNIAILLRCYMERLKRSSNDFLCEFYLRLANEKTNGDLVHKQGSGGQLTRDQLVSKILAPISSNPRILDSFTTKLGGAHSLTLNSTVLMSAPISVNRADDDGPADYNVDELFPTFDGAPAPAQNSADTPPPPQQDYEQQPLPQSAAVGNVMPPKKASSSPDAAVAAATETAEDHNNNNNNNNNNNEVTFTEEELQDAGVQSEDTGKAWKSLQFVENAQIASEAELQSNALMPAPASKLTKRSGKKKKTAKRKSNAADKQQPQQQSDTAAAVVVPAPGAAAEEGVANNQQQQPAALVALSALFSDRIDCLLNASGQIVKHQVVGTLALSYTEGIEIADGSFFYAKLTNMEHVKQRILNPTTTESVEKNGALIRVKLQPNEQDIAVLKYVWDSTHSSDVEQSLPFSVTLQAENEDDNIFNVSCIVTPNEHHAQNKNANMKELSITGSLKDDVSQCVEHTSADDVDFMWNQDLAKKFIWSIKGDVSAAKYVLSAKFKSSSSDNKVSLKIQFDIENDAISTIAIESADNPQNAANIVKTLRCMKSGDFIVR